MPIIKTHRELRAYQTARQAAAFIFKLTLRFPVEEKYGLTAQIRSAIRSLCANITEAWRKRRYPAAFRSKLNEAEGEAAESQTWLDIALDCGYISADEHAEGDDLCDKAIAQIVLLIRDAKKYASINKDATK